VYDDTNDKGEDTGFAEAYRSQILNKDDDIEDPSSKNLIIISILIVVVLALGIFGYKYIVDDGNSKTIKEIEDKKESIIVEEEPVVPPESMMLNNISELKDEADMPKGATEKVTSELDDMADSVKIEMAKELGDDKEKKDEITKPQSANKKAEDTYLEQLADLSKEIDGEK
jgi:hypothetical protein